MADIILSYADYFLLDKIYPADLPQDNLWRQFGSLLMISNISGIIIYLITGALSYHFLFDKRVLKHSCALKNQVEKEIKHAVWSIICGSIPTVAVFMFQVRGYSKLYDRVHQSSWGWYGIILQLIAFTFFTDCLIYWTHRALHHRLIYKYLHKDHHRLKVPTPFASHSANPIDGFILSLPCHIYPFLFPLHKYTYLAMFIFLNLWAISTHDGYHTVPDFLKTVINGTAHHTDHHLFFNYNYGQFFTLWDRIGGSYREPSAWNGENALAQVLSGRCLKKEENGNMPNKQM